MPQLLYDDGDLQTLGHAWAEAPTFAWVSRRNGVTDSWLRERLDALPERHASGRFILLTSGTSGEPKLVVGDRDRSEALAACLHQLQDSEPVAETVVALPLTYTYAFVNQWLWSRQMQRRLVLTDGLRSPERLAAALTAARDAMVCLVGAQLPLMARLLPNRAFPGVIRVHFAGGAFPADRMDFVRRLFPNAQVFNNYGCAEAMPRLTLRLADATPDAQNVGPPLPGIKLRCDDAGRVFFRSPFQCVGQIDNAGFAPFSDDDWVATGDLGELDANGHLVLGGRSNEVFKRYGEKISLSQLLRTVLTSWTGAATLYREVDGSGEPGHVLMLGPQPDRAAVRGVLRALRTTHPRAWWPLRIEGVDALPMLDNGKVDVLAAGALPHKVLHWNQRI